MTITLKVSLRFGVADSGLRLIELNLNDPIFSRCFVEVFVFSVTHYGILKVIEEKVLA